VRGTDATLVSSQPLDDIDRTILEALQQHGHLFHAELGRMVGLAVSSVNERIRKLVQRGVISGWNARLSPSALGLDLLAFVYVLIDRPENSPAFLELVSQLPEVQECHHIAADWNFLLKVRMRNTATFEALLTPPAEGRDRRGPHADRHHADLAQGHAGPAAQELIAAATFP
jgi:Lrp/AsnC family leucine-responsive transcriptional regulator